MCVCAAPHARVRVGASPHVNTRVRVYGQRSVVSPIFVHTHTHTPVCVLVYTSVLVSVCSSTWAYGGFCQVAHHHPVNFGRQHHSTYILDLRTARHACRNDYSVISKDTREKVFKRNQNAANASCA